MCFATSIYSMLSAIFLFGLTFVIVCFNSDSLLQFLLSSDLRVLNKFARLFEAGAALGARDVMMANYLELIDKNYLLGLMLLPPELAYPDAGIDIKSAHNFYVDTWAWTGFPGFVFMLCFIVVLLVFAVGNIFRGMIVKRPNKAEIGFSWVVILVLVVSNNINVPLRQPVIVPLFLFCVFVMICYRGSLYSLVRENSFVKLG